jgi:hypothetical protein
LRSRQKEPWPAVLLSSSLKEPSTSPAPRFQTTQASSPPPARRPRTLLCTQAFVLCREGLLASLPSTGPTCLSPSHASLNDHPYSEQTLPQDLTQLLVVHGLLCQQAPHLRGHQVVPQGAHGHGLAASRHRIEGDPDARILLFAEPPPQRDSSCLKGQSLLQDVPSVLLSLRSLGFRLGACVAAMGLLPLHCLC